VWSDGTCLLGVIGFILHGMMGSSECCALVAYFNIQKITLNELKRFIIKIAQSKKVSFTNKHFFRIS
jgi:hypothetical protein